MKTRKLLFLLLVILVASGAAIGQSNSKKIDDLLKKYAEYGQFNGTVLVAEKGKVIYKKGHGMANMEWDIPNAPDTKFRIGSVTKQFTAALIMQFVEEGKIKLDDKITDHLKDYRKDTGDKITIHQLLNHTSGIPSYTGLPGFFQKESRNPYSVDDFVKKFASGDLEFEPGSKFNYNNSGYFLLGAIIEKVSGMKYEQAVSNLIFKPLGMKNSGYDNHSPLIKKRARGYQKTPFGYTNAPYLDMGIPYAAGSLYSTVEDLYIWDQSLYANKIVSAESKQKMFTPGKANYGYGFDIRDRKLGKSDKTVKIVSHGGGINGFNCLFSRSVNDKNLVIILDNVTQGRYHGPMTVGILSILNGVEYENPKKSITEVMMGTILSKDLNAAIAQYRQLKSNDNGTYNFGEDQLNTVGYQLLRTGNLKEAIEIFKLNVEMFPNASNPYDSLGEAYLMAKDNDNALINYKKAYELDQSNTNAKEVIEKLGGKVPVSEPVAKSEYDEYVGDYELGQIGTVTVSLEGGKLYSSVPGQGSFELVPSTTKDEFSVSEVGAIVKFTRGDDGSVTGLSVDVNGQEFLGSRVD